MSADFPIITKLGGREAVLEHLERLGKRRLPGTLTVWLHRGYIPASIQTALMKVAQESSIAVDWTDFERPDHRSEAA